MFQENTGILPEQNGIPRRESERRFVATFQQLEMYGNVVQEIIKEANPGSKRGNCLDG